MSTADKLANLRRLREESRLGGGEQRDRAAARAQQADRARTDRAAARRGIRSWSSTRSSRIGRPTSALDEERYLGDGVVSGHGAHRRPAVFVYAQDFTVFGGSLSEAHAEKICKVMDLAMSTGAPIIGLSDSGGARIQEGVASLGGYAEIFLRNTLASGVVPQISVVMGPCAGGAVYSPAITDFTVMVDGSSYMFVTGPNVVKTVTHEEIDLEGLGGARVHNETSGVAHFLAEGEPQAMELTRRILGYMPQNNIDAPPAAADWRAPDVSGEELDTLVPDSAQRPTTCAGSSPAIVDAESFTEVHEHFARNVICGFARVEGRSVGIVAQQPEVLAGVLDIDASDKAARFVRFCDCFNIPLVTLVDVPGFLPGVDQEHRRHHSPRREAAVRLLRGDRPEGHRHHAQGIWRRLRRHEQQACPRRPELRVADGGDRGDGRRGRGEHHLPRSDRRSRRRGCGTGARWSPSTRSGSRIRTSPPRAATSTR